MSRRPVYCLSIHTDDVAPCLTEPITDALRQGRLLGFGSGDILIVLAMTGTPGDTGPSNSKIDTVRDRDPWLPNGPNSSLPQLFSRSGFTGSTWPRTRQGRTTDSETTNCSSLPCNRDRRRTPGPGLGRSRGSAVGALARPTARDAVSHIGG